MIYIYMYHVYACIHLYICMCVCLHKCLHRMIMLCITNGWLASKKKLITNLANQMVRVLNSIVILYLEIQIVF